MSDYCGEGGRHTYRPTREDFSLIEWRLRAEGSQRYMCTYMFSYTARTCFPALIHVWNNTISCTDQIAVGNKYQFAVKFATEGNDSTMTCHD